MRIVSAFLSVRRARRPDARVWPWLLAGLLASAPALAHKVNLFTYVEGDQLYVEGYFTDGKIARDSEVTVYGPDDQVLAEGVTDDEGRYTFPISQPMALRVVLDGGQGHQASNTISAEELGAAGSAQAAPVRDATAKGDEPGANRAMPVSEEAFEQVVTRAVREGVRPLAKRIDELKESQRLSDIIGGIGFIVGILGAVAYVQARRRR